MPASVTKVRAPDEQAIEALLDHVARYRLTTFAVAARLPKLSGLGRGGLRRLLRQCGKAGLLSSTLLHAGVRYWFLTERGARRQQLDVSRSGPLSETAKLRAYALLIFCCLTEAPRYRLTAADLRDQFPILYRAGLPGGYYLDPAGAGRIGLARVDAGHRGRWDRIVQSLRDDIALHSRQPGFRQLVEARRFEITVLTVLPEKARRLVGALQSLPELKHVPVHVVAQPELLPLVYSSRGKERRSRLPRHGFHRSRPGSTEKQRAS